MGRLLQYISLICCVFVILSFFLFAIAQTHHASQGQANAVASGATGGSALKAKPIDKERQPRRFIDQVAAKLNSPWNGIVSTNNVWVKHLIPTAFSLLIWGFALSFLGRWITGLWWGRSY
jgi:hypothetical protein